MKGSRIQGVKGSSDMIKNYKMLNVWKKSYRAGSKRGTQGCRESAKSHDQVPGKQTLESLNPGLLGPFSHLTHMSGAVTTKDENMD